MSWLTSSPANLAITAGKAALMYGTALLGLRVAERRTLAQWTAIDFAAAVAIGAIVGRSALAKNQTYAVGAVALLVILAVHRVVSVGRMNRLFARLVDHRVRLLVHDGRLLRRNLRLCGLTDDDLFGQLRQRGFVSLSNLRYVIYEAKGGLTVVPTGAHPSDAELISRAQTALTRVPARGRSRRSRTRSS